MISIYSYASPSSSIGKSAALVSPRSRVRIRYKREFFFQAFLFATEKVASIVAMILFHIILHPAVLIYGFHTFITSYCYNYYYHRSYYCHRYRNSGI